MNCSNEKLAFTISEFCIAYGVGRTKAYAEISSGRLKACKAGKRTLVRKTDADSWLEALPLAGVANG